MAKGNPYNYVRVSGYGGYARREGNKVIITLPHENQKDAGRTIDKLTHKYNKRTADQPGGYSKKQKRAKRDPFDFSNLLDF